MKTVTKVNMLEEIATVVQGAEAVVEDNSNSSKKIFPVVTTSQNPGEVRASQRCKAQRVDSADLSVLETQLIHTMTTTTITTTHTNRATLRYRDLHGLHREKHAGDRCI